jgi:GDP-4-dehydro-6-deoxy-D-mannose reductase
MRVLITGAAGFVGPHVAEALQRVCGKCVEIVATSKVGGQHPLLGSVMTLDIVDRGAVGAAIASIRPTHVVHLAGFAAPAAAGGDPEALWRLHVQGTIDLARAILLKAPDCCLINVGSGLVYGESARSGRALDENTVLAPIDEYSVTKAAADLALGALARRGLKCIRVRPFNHSGPGQSEAFVIPAFAMQIARIEAGLQPPVIRVGNLDAQRDFLDVRDVANAYALAVRSVGRLEPGIVLNVASGVPRRISDVLSGLVARSRSKISIEHDPTRNRPNDLPIIVGDASRAREILDWKPEHTFDDMLTAVMTDCRARAVKPAMVQP